MGDGKGRGVAATILVLHYDAPLREFLAAALADAGYRVLGAAEPDQALALAARERLALALVGTIPRGDFGRGFARADARRPGPRAPTVLLSTAEDLAAVPAAEGVTAAVPEPFELDDLLATVERLLPPERGPNRRCRLPA